MKTIYLLLLAFCLVGFGSCKEEDVEKELKTVAELSDGQLTFARTETELSVTLTANKAWKVSDQPEWLQVDPASGEAGTHTLTVSVEENTEEGERSGKVKIAVVEVEKELTVVQTERAVVIADNAYYEVASGDTLLEVGVRTNMELQVAIRQEGEWLKQAPDGKAVTVKNYLFDIAANTTSEARTAEIIFTETETNKCDTVRVLQQATAVLEVAGEMKWAYNQVRYALPVVTNRELAVEIPSELGWLDYEVKKDTIVFTGTANDTKAQRKGQVLVKSTDGSLQVPVDVVQSYKLEDGDVIVLQRATKGKGIDLIFMGDGYDRKDIDSRKYENTLEEGAEYFFGIEPYTTYRDYFNVYVVVAESNESGMSHSKLFPPFKEVEVDTKFKTRDDGSGMEADNFSLIGDYAQKARTNPAVADYIAIVISNFDYYMGSCWMGMGLGHGQTTCVFSASYQGKSPEGLKELVQHEAGGHAFGCLGDEYMIGTEIDEADRDYLLRSQENYGWYANLSVAEDKMQSSWARFIGHEKYPEIGWFEGGFTYFNGVWRATQTSVMGIDSKKENYVWEFNAPSRAEIVRRIKELSGEEFSFEAFVAEDKLAGAWPEPSATNWVETKSERRHCPVRLMPNE